jgi:SAM-dependent methyltransferase
MTDGNFDRQKAEEFTGKVMGDLAATMSSAMIYLGDQLGLFKAMNGAGPLSVAQLAQKTGLQERYLREWASQMAAAGYIEYDAAGETFLLPPEHAAPLADEDSPVFLAGFYNDLPDSFNDLPRLADAFRRGGGIAFAEKGLPAVASIERGFRPGYVNFLLQQWIPGIPGVKDKLEAGAKAADIGCGAGVALCLLAPAFPNSLFTGFDNHAPSIERARENARAAGSAPNLTFEQRSALDLPQDHSFDFITTFDCIHDMADPMGAFKAIKGALKPDGTWLLVDINGGATLQDNLHPMGAMMYGFSILSCMTVSLALGGAGLGTLGLHMGKAQELAEAAGFTRFNRLEDLTNEFNAFYEIKP